MGTTHFTLAITFPAQRAGNKSWLMRMTEAKRQKMQCSSDIPSGSIT